MLNVHRPLDSLIYIEGFLSELEEYKLVAHIDDSSWDHSLKRKVQHYGYKYDYHSGNATEKAAPIPEWIPYPGFDFDQVIINNYEPGQGIAFHRDAPAYGDTIASLSLLSSCVMDFKLKDVLKHITLEPRSLLIMQGESRSLWQHSIAARKIDNGVKRERRISITYRSLKV